MRSFSVNVFDRSFSWKIYYISRVGFPDFTNQLFFIFTASETFYQRTSYKSSEGECNTSVIRDQIVFDKNMYRRLLSCYSCTKSSNSYAFLWETCQKRYLQGDSNFV